MIYVLDANIFLTPARAMMTMEHCPGFWEWLRELSEQGTVRTTTRVRGECQTPAFVPEWMDATPSLIANDGDAADVVVAYGGLMEWAAERAGYLADKRQVAFDDFATGVDAWLVAYAMALTARGEKAAVVTAEVSDRRCTTKIKIPDVCSDHGVTCLAWLDFFRTARPAPRFCWAQA